VYVAGEWGGRGVWFGGGLGIDSWGKGWGCSSLGIIKLV
jgi:hypothetical protein